MTETYYSLKEVAKLLKVSYLTVYRWTRANQLTTMRAGKQYRVKKEDVEKFMSKKVNI